MPKKPATPLAVRSSPYAEPANPASLLQCARRRLQYSQLPVRCSSSKRSGRLVSSLKKFPVLGASGGAAGHHQRCCSSAKSCPEDAPSTARFIAAAAGCSPVGRKSLSMTDLNAQPASSDFDSESGSTSARLEDERRTEESLSVEGCSSLGAWPTLLGRQPNETDRAASLVCRALAVNAWRRRREEVAELRCALEACNQQLDHLQIQIVVLRRLLDNENARVASLAGELHKAKAQMEEIVKERDSLKNDKEAAEAEAQRQREISEERAVGCENLRNELKSARDQLDGLDKQIGREREKLLKLREDKRILIEKVASSEALAQERLARAEKADSALEEAQLQLATQIGLTDSLREEVQRFVDTLKEKESEKLKLEEALRKMEEENVKVEERLQESEESERSLCLRAADLESQLFSQESKIKRIEAAYLAQLSELSELRERVLQHSQESGWSSRVLQLAGSVVRAPRVIFRTLSFFSTGMPL